MCNTYLSCTLNIKSIWRVDRVTCFDILCRKMFISFLFIFLGFEMRSQLLSSSRNTCQTIHVYRICNKEKLMLWLIKSIVDSFHVTLYWCHSFLLFCVSYAIKTTSWCIFFISHSLYFSWIFYTHFPHSFTAFLNFSDTFSRLHTVINKITILPFIIFPLVTKKRSDEQRY